MTHFTLHYNLGCFLDDLYLHYQPDPLSQLLSLALQPKATVRFSGLTKYMLSLNQINLKCCMFMMPFVPRNLKHIKDEAFAKAFKFYTTFQQRGSNSATTIKKIRGGDTVG